MRGLHYLAVVIAIGCGGAAAAQMLPNSMVRGMDGNAMRAVAPVVQQVIADGKPGATRPWRSGDKNGKVRLLGADKTQPKCKRVRMNAVVAGVEQRGYVFRYCPDAEGNWRIAG